MSNKNLLKKAERELAEAIKRESETGNLRDMTKKRMEMKLSELLSQSAGDRALEDYLDSCIDMDPIWRIKRRLFVVRNQARAKADKAEKRYKSEKAKMDRYVAASKRHDLNRAAEVVALEYKVGQLKKEQKTDEQTT